VVALCPACQITGILAQRQLKGRNGNVLDVQKLSQKSQLAKANELHLIHLSEKEVIKDVHKVVLHERQALFHV
jgi:hypothetical protein